MHDLVHDVMVSIIHISYLKWLNEKQSYKLQVKHLGRDQKRHDIQISASDVLDELYRIEDNKNKHIITEEELLEFERHNPLLSDVDYLNISNGHDLLWALSQHIQCSGGSGNWNEERSWLVIAASTCCDGLMRTKKFTAIRKWQRKMEKRILQVS